jgi:hypothetical protein
LPANETIGATVFAFGAAFGIHTELLRLVRLKQESRNRDIFLWA